MNNKRTLNYFLTLYFYQIETLLNNFPSGLEKIKFQSEEANTDEFIKKYFQNFLLKNNRISTNLDIRELVYRQDGIEQVIKIEELYSYQILDVLLPEQLSVEQKNKIMESKNSVYTSPDLFLKISNGKEYYFESVELKSTKDNTIPGSSVQQVVPFEWVIFLKRTQKKVIVTTGFYLHSVTEKLPFPDRSPRPQISFKTLQEWNNSNRNTINNQLIVKQERNQDNAKIRILENWQDYLVLEWLEIVLASKKIKKEKWFNNTIRKFTLKFIEHSNKLSKVEYEHMKINLKKLIDQ